MKNLSVLAALLLTACAPAAPEPTPAPLDVQYTFAAQTWLSAVQGCSPHAPLDPELRPADRLDPSAGGLAIRIGVPAPLLFPAYQIASEEVVVVIHPQNPVSSLTLEQVRGLFGGAISNWSQIGGADRLVQPWVFSPAEDIQQIFAAAVMEAGAVSSTARLAPGPAEMSTSVSADPGAVGILTRHWSAGNTQAAFTVATVPVIALTAAEPRSELQTILECLQQ